MAQSEPIVDTVADISTESATFGTPTAASTVRVTLGDGRVGLLDPSSPRDAVWAEVLGELRAANHPAYLEIDAETSAITELLVPLVVHVGELTEADNGDLDVELIISHARHVLRREHASYDIFRRRLEEARVRGAAVLVTETPDHDIIDVRSLPDALGPPPQYTELTEEMGPTATVAPATASQMFAMVSGTTCCPTSAAAPCIPFAFPDDGCWGRAHEMYRLMLSAGVEAAKVWIYGTLRTATANHPACAVEWRWHVAPTLSVDVGGTTQTWVIDPALFTGPVPQATWAGVQGDPAASLVPSSGTVFHRTIAGGVTHDDASYSRTRAVLDTYRAQLRLRSVSSSGPPPYPQCMTRPPGVQWIGTLAGDATARWYTFGWPAAWHVLWTIMPLTACVGAPQLSWSVQVERASATSCTYWITVRNLTPGTVRFEGRYDVLSR